MGGPITKELGRLAAEYDLPLLGSFVEATDTRPRNTCVIFDQSGALLTSYAKIHLFSPAGEDRDYVAGNALATFTLGDVHFGVAICYDLRFAPLFYLYALRRVECVIIPAAWPCRRIHEWELLLAARALESQAYVAGVNRTGTTPVEKYCGHSLIASPDGGILVRASEEEELLWGEIDPARVRRARETFPILDKYRSDLYPRLASERE